MSDHLDITSRTIYPNQPFKLHWGSQVYEQSTTIIGASQRQVRPQSISTEKVGDAYVMPSQWSHRGCYNTSPTTSGKVQPIGLPYIYDWSYLPGMFEVGPNPDNISWPSVGEADDLVKAATTQALLNLKDQKVNLGVALAEAKETAGLVSNAARRATKLLQAGLNRRPKEWLKGVRNAGTKNWSKVPSYYLEHVFGLVPVMSDVDGACQQLAETLNRGNSPLVTAYAERSSTSEVDLALTEMQQFGQLRGYGTQKNVARVGIVAEAPSWVIQDYSSLGLTNPFSIAWERVPYSFVLDWFLPIGDWINTWDVGNYLHFKSGYTTRFVSRTGSVVPVENPGCPLWQVRIDLAGRFRHWNMDRTPMINFPSASYPSLRNGLNLNSVASSLAMLAQTVNKHKRAAWGIDTSVDTD